MKIEIEIKEGIETGSDFIQEDCGYLKKAIDRKDWADVIKKLDSMSATAAALLAAEEILN